MLRIKKRKLLTLALSLALALTTSVVNIPDAYAATVVDFTHSKASVSKSYLSKFNIDADYEEGKEFKLAFSESGAKAFNSEGMATMSSLKNTTKASKLIFHYAIYLDEATTKGEKLKIQNALTYLHQGSKGLTNAQVTKAKAMIAESQKYAIPPYYNFKAYRFKSLDQVKGKYPSFIAYRCDPYQIRVGISYQDLAYKEAVKKVGGYPVYLPYVTDEAGAIAELAKVDCLLIPGGTGINPSYYGETVRNSGKGSPKRDPADYNYIKVALSIDMPILAICRGHQMVNVVTGGTLFQDIKKEYGSSEKHKKVVHSIRVFKGSLLADIIGSGSHSVYCSHHQCVGRIGSNIKVNARSTNGVIEASNVLGQSFALTLQFHPESAKMKNSLDTYKIFKRFVNEGSKFVERMGHERLYMRDVHEPTEKEINDALDAAASAENAS